MSLASLSAIWLLLAPCATPSDVVHINRRNFKIPIQIDLARKAEMKELILFSSSDQGQQWQQVAKAPPDQDAFSFYAPGDGQYWFTVSVVDVQGNRQPPDIYNSPPSQKIEVDTTKPVFRHFNAERRDGEIIVTWEIQEEHLDANLFKLDYLPADSGDMGAGMPVSVNPSASGRANFHHSGLSALKVRMQVQDMAGNVTSIEKVVPAAASPADSVSALPGARPQPPAPAVMPSFPPPAPDMQVQHQMAASPQGNPQQLPSMAGSPYESGGLQRVNVPAHEPAPPVSPYRVPVMEQPPAMNNNLPPPAPGFGISGQGMPSPPASPPTGGMPAYTGFTPPPAGGMETGGPRPIAEAGGAASYTPRVQGPAGASNGPGAVPLQVTNMKRFALEFAVTREGPSKVSSVELYITPDTGTQTYNWKLHVDHKDLNSPVPVELPHEGVFGLRMVLRSGAGLSKGPPSPSDPPEMRVEYDSTAPWAQLYEPKPDPQRPNVLTLTWAATDRNLAPNPISLEWSLDPRAGGWTPIGPAEMPNNGSFNWEVPPGHPARVYLRLLVRDTAGNISQAITREPILVDLNRPEGKLLGIVGTLHQP